MTPFLQLILALIIIIVAAKLGGLVSYRLGQPTVLGELLVGLLIGPTFLNIFHLPYFTDEHLGEVIHQMAELGVLLLMFLAGLELHLSDLAKSRRVAALAGVLGVLLPVGLGWGMGLAFAMDSQQALFIGLILAATSVSISAQTLMELNVLRSRVGIGLLGAAVFDDVLVVLGLSLFIALASGGSGWTSVLTILLSMIVYLAIALAVGLLILPRLSRLVQRMPISQGLLAFTFVTILLYGWMAEAIGNMAAITGAFVAGLMLARSPVRDRIENGASVLAYGVFVPIFFVNVGLMADGRQLLGDAFWLFLVMVVVAVFGKVVGAGLGALMSGFNRQEALQLGVGMMSRGEVGLIVASVGLTQNLISESTFAAVVGVVIVTTLLTPPLLRSLFGPVQKSAAVQQKPVKGEDR